MVSIQNEFRLIPKKSILRTLPITQSLSERKIKLDKIANKFGIQEPRDWGKVSDSSLRKFGLGASLDEHQGSLFNLLRTVYTDIPWKEEWFSLSPSNIWKKIENHRKFLEEFAKKHDIKKPEDWGKITLDYFKQQGGDYLINLYGFSLQKALKKTHWKEEWFAQVPKKYWNIDRQREFLDKKAKELGIAKPSDWGKITNQKFREHGGGTIITQFGSLWNALKSIYSDIEWDQKWFIHLSEYSKGHWKNKENHRKFLLEFSKYKNILEPQDWGKVTVEEFTTFGGSRILQIYGDSLFKTLQNVFPEEKWNPMWFINRKTVVNGFWQKAINRRRFLDKVAFQFGIKTPREWNKVTLKMLFSVGGAGLVSKYKYSILRMLQSVYSEVEWNRKWFRNSSHQFPSEYFDNLSNQKQFMDLLSSQYSIIQPTQWRRVTIGLIRKKGGNTLLRRYNNSLPSILQTVYPHENWNSLLQVNIKLKSSGPQHILSKYSKDWFGIEEVFQNYRHSKILHSLSNQNIELDVWIPKYELAFEYQGVQHYKIIFNKENKHVSEQLSRDQEKKLLCEKAGITLIQVPYWWDEREESLLATVIRQRSDLLTSIRSPILDQENLIHALLSDDTMAIPQSMKFKDKDFVMLSTWWTIQNPTNWYLSEKMDGIRAYWDGSDMYYRGGNRISLPSWFTENLPRNFALDGELWSGRLSFHDITRKIQTGDLNGIKFMIFDAPEFPGIFSKRLEKLEHLHFGDYAELVKHQICRGKDHLMRELEETIRSGGEGLVIKDPLSNYVVGRTQYSQKVKPLYTEFVQVVELEDIILYKGKTKFNYLTVRNKHGFQFKLSTRVSAAKFPHLHRGAVIEIGFTGLHTQGLPKFPIILECKEGASWDKVVSYFADRGSKYVDHVSCEGCSKKLIFGTLRIQVKGIDWKSHIGKEPHYNLFSFCASRECVETGTAKMADNGVQFPRFEGILGSSEQINNIINITDQSSYSIERFYVLKECST